MTEPLSPAAQKDESYDFLSKWFEYDTRSPSCIKWKNRPPHGRKGAGEYCAQLTCWCSPQLDRNDDCLVLHQAMTTADQGWVLIGELEGAQ